MHDTPKVNCGSTVTFGGNLFYFQNWEGIVRCVQGQFGMVENTPLRVKGLICTNMSQQVNGNENGSNIHTSTYFHVSVGGKSSHLTHSFLIESSNAPMFFQVCHISTHDEDATLTISAKVCLNTTQVIPQFFVNDENLIGCWTKNRDTPKMDDL